MERSFLVHAGPLMLIAFLCGTTRSTAQSIPEQVGVLSARLEALAGASDDAARDSLNTLVSSGVHALLGAPGAMQADLKELPMARVDAPDGRFRLLTWNTVRADGGFTYHGVMLVQEAQRTVLYDLADRTATITEPGRRKLDAANWYGSLYYAVIPRKVRDRTYYTLLGWKGVSAVETHKVIDVLSFNGPVPVFGANLFDDGRQRPLRKVFAFNAQVTMSLKWEPENEAIVFDHLSPLRPELEGRPEFAAPDMSFDAYVWHKNAWRYLRDVDARNMDLVPRPTKPVEKGLR